MDNMRGMPHDANTQFATEGQGQTAAANLPQGTMHALLFEAKMLGAFAKGHSFQTAQLEARNQSSAFTTANGLWARDKVEG